MAQGVRGSKMKKVKKHEELGKRLKKHLLRSIKCSFEQLHFDRLHAACMHSACTPVKIEFLKNGFILMSVHDAHII